MKGGPPLYGVFGLYVALARAGPASLLTAAQEAMKRFSFFGSAVAAAADPAAELALCRARVGELEARLASSEAERGELRARLAALDAAFVSLDKEHNVHIFLERLRDFGAELPSDVLLNIMDRVPDIKCVSVEVVVRVHPLLYLPCLVWCAAQIA